MHPAWRVKNARESALDCEVATLYGEEFVEPLSAAPASAFLAIGSEISVHQGSALPP